MTAGGGTVLSRDAARPLPRFGLGTAALGNLYRRVEEDEAQATIARAMALGLFYVDTAPQYGLGLSEERVGRALARSGGERPILSTKVGRLLEDCAPAETSATAFVGTPDRRIVYDYSHDGVMRSFEASCRRLGVERVDILFVHDVDAFTHGSREASDARVRELFDRGGYRALCELRAAGHAGAIGAGVNEWQVCQTLLEQGDFDGFLLAGRYTLLEQDALETFLPLCEHRDVGIVLGGPFNSGILATGAVAGACYDYAPAPPAILQRVAGIERVCRAHGVELAAAALQFPLGHPAVRCVIPGAASVAELETNASFGERAIPSGFWGDLKAEGYVRPDAPTPEAN